MSTRSTTHFVHGDEPPVAIVYRHTDGYPEGAGVDIHRFLERVEQETADTRFGDASYLAAKYVVFLAEMFASRRPLDFLSVGIVREDYPDIEYRYIVDCGVQPDSSRAQRPTVRCLEIHDPAIGDHREVPIPVPSVSTTDADELYGGYRYDDEDCRGWTEEQP